MQALRLPAHPDAKRLVYGGLADAIRPPEPLPFSQWLPKNLVLVDGPAAGELWGAEGAPYLVEIADTLSDDHPANLITVRKSQQSGASILALGWCLYVADREPANVLYGCPGIDALREMNSAKLQPLIDAWHKQVKRIVVVPQTSRSGRGSTTYEKVYPGGRLFLANANSVMDLSGKTIKKGVKDELSKWAMLENGADPETLFFGRFTAFRRARNWKILEISTPEIDSGDDLAEAEGHCRIDRSFRRSDQRFWNVPCPECGAFFVHRFDQLQIDAVHPHRSAYRCPHCGHDISDAERIPAIRAGRWIAEASDQERHPGFHIDAFISPMMSYADIAADSVAAKTETAKKDFSNLVLGLPYKYRGDAPDHVRLLERVEPHLKRGHVPPQGLILVAFADVQMRGIWLEVAAFAPNRESWCVDARYIDGDTSSPHNAVFEQLRKETFERQFPDAFGRLRSIDALGIDSGYRAHVVYSWVRRNQRPHGDTGRDLILATKGLKGWGRPALGQPTLVDIDLAGEKVKQGCKVWGIGTWPLKVTVYAELREDYPKPPAPRIAPEGFAHFGPWCDEVYFKQLTAEQLDDVKFRGRVTSQRWLKSGPNHFHDCRVGNRALAEYLGLASTTPEEWAALARVRGLPEELSKVDLFTPRTAAPSLDPAQADAAIAKSRADDRQKADEAARMPWIPRQRGWLRKR